MYFHLIKANFHLIKVALRVIKMFIGVYFFTYLQVLFTLINRIGYAKPFYILTSFVYFVESDWIRKTCDDYFAKQTKKVT
jgi:hypothetical protein